MVYAVKIDGKTVNKFDNKAEADLKAQELNDKLFAWGSEAYVETD